MRRTVAPAVLVLSFAAGVCGQSVQVEGPQPGTVKLGQSALIVVSCEGTQEAELVALPRVDGVTLRAGSPNTSSMTSIVGGRVERSVSIRWRIEVLPRRTGTFRIPPFEVRVGAARKKTQPATIRCVEDVRAQELSFVEAGVLPERPFVHQPVDVWVRVGVAREVVGVLIGGATGRGLYPLEITAPWLDEFPAGLRAKPDEPTKIQGQVHLRLNGDWHVVQPLADRNVQGRDFAVFELRRRFITSRSGSFALDPAFLRFSYATRVTRNLFGELQAEAKEDIFGRSKPIAVRVQPLPDAGRPASFRNAVGTFTTRAELAKREVKVGESFTLSLHVEGDGNLEFLEVPALDDLEGFHLFGKNVQRGDGRVVASYDLAALDDTRSELPRIPFSFFDPGREPPGYVDASVGPLPIEVVGVPGGKGLDPLPESGKALAPGVDDIWDRLPVGGPPPRRFRPDTPVVLAAMLGPFVVFLAGVLFVRRRRWLRENPDVVRRQRAAATFRERLGAEGALRAFSRYVADRIGWDDGAAVRPDLEQRLVESGLSEPVAQRVDELMQDLLQSRYAGGAEHALDERAAVLVGEIERELS